MKHAYLKANTRDVFLFWLIILNDIYASTTFH